ncbi:holo-ACP synthase [Nocardia ninae]|uniref:Holo-[acyl-carrier-protein] synthase n=1 Tax=Nocardia ninae NBRC 108245 TaxID=1210091 RepID=A0A511MDV5_9NOCA|nr:holo-ACP synthase [Nocardia ninae]GEM38779.1 holo-[acyl-carrier-protein] synthase [Nocardia ninae NBRC 108245]
MTTIPASVLLPAISGAAAMSVGIDIAAVARVRALLATGTTFAERVFRPAEIAYCAAFRDPAPHFAARFSAKEATLKALHVGLGLPPATRRLRDIEVCRSTGAPRLLLHNRLMTRARRLGITGAALSLSHDGDYAIAYVLLTGFEGAHR